MGIKAKTVINEACKNFQYIHRIDENDKFSKFEKITRYR